MIITCNECNTHFNLDESLLQQTGSKVRCSKCKNVFLAYPSSLSEEPDKSSEVETELEAVITDEEIESGEQYKVEEELEGIELTTDEAFEENTKVKEKPEEAGLELELDLEPEIDETQAETEVELELESGDKTDSEISAKEEPEEIEIAKETETKIEESKQEDIDQDKTPGKYTMGFLPDEQEAEKEIKPVDRAEKGTLTEESKPQKVAAKKRISTPVLLLLFATLLISGAYGTYVLLDSVGINIPFVSALLKPEVQDAGNLKIYTSDINNKFVENSKIGKLLVITGKAKNGYSNARSYISITGKLYTKGKILSKTKTVYCGTVLSELDLINMDLDSINNRLSNRFGDNKSNVKVKVGAIIPFMVVFADFPENPDEFTIEVAGSFPS